MLIDVKANWRLINLWTAGKGWDAIPKPERDRLTTDDSTVVLTDMPDLIEIRDWLAINTTKPVKLFATLEIAKFQYRIDRRATGLIFRFDQADEAIFAKLRWG